MESPEAKTRRRFEERMNLGESCCSATDVKNPTLLKGYPKQARRVTTLLDSKVKKK
jgi:hypothetical protein